MEQHTLNFFIIIQKIMCWMKIWNFFLSEALCESDFDPEIFEPCNSDAKYYASHRIKYKKLFLINDNGDIPEIQEYRTALLDFLFEEFRKYFPDGNLKNFNVSDPKQCHQPMINPKLELMGQLKLKQLTIFSKYLAKRQY